MTSVGANTDLFRTLVEDVEEAIGKVAKEVAENNFLLDVVKLEIQAVVEQHTSAGGLFTIQIVPVEAGWDSLDTTVHTFTLTLRPKPPKQQLSATSDLLAQAIFAIFSSVSQIERESPDKLTPSDINLKLRFEIQESWNIKIIFGKGRKRLNSHTIELQFHRPQ
jgi:hypothetical protein